MNDYFFLNTVFDVVANVNLDFSSCEEALM